MLECSPGAVARSELQLSLTLNPQLQRLNIGVFEGRYLQATNKNEGVYIKIIILQVYQVFVISETNENFANVYPYNGNNDDRKY